MLRLISSRDAGRCWFDFCFFASSDVDIVDFRGKFALLLALFPLNLLSCFICLVFHSLALSSIVELFPFVVLSFLCFWTCSFIVFKLWKSKNLRSESALVLLLFEGLAFSCTFFTLVLILLASLQQVISIGLVLVHFLLQICFCHVDRFLVAFRLVHLRLSLGIIFISPFCLLFSSLLYLMLHAIFREQLVALVNLLCFSRAQLVLSSSLVKSTNQIGVAIVLLGRCTDVESENCCHKDFEMFGYDSLAIIRIPFWRQFLRFFLLASTWL